MVIYYGIILKKKKTKTNPRICFTSATCSKSIFTAFFFVRLYDAPKSEEAISKQSTLPSSLEVITDNL